MPSENCESREACQSGGCLHKCCCHACGSVHVSENEINVRVYSKRCAGGSSHRHIELFHDIHDFIQLTSLKAIMILHHPSYIKSQHCFLHVMFVLLHLLLHYFVIWLERRRVGNHLVVHSMSVEMTSYGTSATYWGCFLLWYFRKL